MAVERDQVLAIKQERGYESDLLDTKTPISALV